MLTQKTINITLGIVVAVIIISVAAMSISVNNRLSFLEGKTSK